MHPLPTVAPAWLQGFATAPRTFPTACENFTAAFLDIEEIVPPRHAVPTCKRESHLRALPEKPFYGLHVFRRASLEAKDGRSAFVRSNRHVNGFSLLRPLFFHGHVLTELLGSPSSTKLSLCGVGHRLVLFFLFFP